METFFALLAICAGNSPRYWPFVRGIHRPPVNSLHKGQWRGALMFSFICARINGWINNGWWFETPLCPLWRHCNDTPCSDITWASRRLKSPVTWLLAQDHVQANTKATPKPRITSPFCEGNPPLTGLFPSQRVNNAENVSMSWRHPDLPCLRQEAHRFRRT